jgi:uncharacterized integral membrane protein
LSGEEIRITKFSMGALLKLVVTLPFVAVLLWLSFANRDTVNLLWSPLHEKTDIALAVVILIAVISGFIWGALITWINYGTLRRAARINNRALTKLEKELVTVKAQTTTAVAVQSPPTSSQAWNP